MTVKISQIHHFNKCYKKLERYITLKNATKNQSETSHDSKN